MTAKIYNFVHNSNLSFSFISFLCQNVVRYHNFKTSLNGNFIVYIQASFQESKSDLHVF